VLFFPHKLKKEIKNMGIVGNNKPKVLLYDLEVSPILGWSYPPLYETRILKTEKNQCLMSISWAWLGENDKKGKLKVYNVKLNDFPARFKNDHFDDYDLTKKLHEILSEAQIVIAHNGRRFDNKMANTFFVKHKLGPTSPYKTVDTLTNARGIFKFASNSLDNICKELGLAGKTDIKVNELWYDCLINGDKKAWKLMQEYNDQDINALHAIYLMELPYITNHPNMGVLQQQQGVCSNCGKSGTFQSRGTETRVNGMVRRFWCNPSKGGCTHWNNERIVEEKLLKEDRPDIVSAR
jgi:hypothetical protein